MAAPAIKLEFPEEYTLVETNQKIKKRLDRFTQKGIEQVSEFIGSTAIEAMFYIYLLKKYKSSCFLTESNGDFWEIFGINLRIREIYSEEEFEQISGYLKSLSTKLVNCINNGVNIIIIPLGLTLFYPDREETDGHANVLIYRKKFNHIEHFEPHGKTGSFGNEKLNRSIDLFLKLFIEYVNIELLKHKTPAQIQNLKPIELIESTRVCPRLKGFQTLEEDSELFKFEEIESGGYCVAWSMFFTELCLKNPQMTSSQIIESVFSAAFKKSLFYTSGVYFRHIIRGYATFINEKISKYFKFLLDDNKIDIAKLKKITRDERILVVKKMKMIVSIEIELTSNPNAIDDKIKYLQKNDRRFKLYDAVESKAFRSNQLEMQLLKKYKKYVDDFNSPIDTPPTPPSLQVVKTQKPPIICPPGKVLNPKTNRCVKDKYLKTIKQEIKERKEVLKQELQKITKECPPGKVLNPDTGRCVKAKVVKPVKLVIKKEPNESKTCPPGKVLNLKTGRCVKAKIQTQKIKKELKELKEAKNCPHGKVLNPKTGRCVKAKIQTRKIKKELKAKKESKICPSGKVLNPKTGRCVKAKIQTRKIKKELKKPNEPNESKETKETNESKEPNESKESKEPKELKEPVNKLKECPPGKVLNPKTGRCVKVKIGTRKIKKEPKS